MKRVKHIRAIFKHALAIRMARFLLVYGFGGIVNIELRKFLKREFIHPSLIIFDYTFDH